MFFPDLAISNDYQSSNSTKHTLSLAETLNSFYDYIADISLIFKEYFCIFFQSFIEFCLKFKFLSSKTDFLKKNIQNFRTLKKETCP